jgi:hypothetical protein
MSPTLEKALLSAGWSPTRQVSTSEWVAALSADGFDVIPDAADVMAGFGGLTFRTVALPSSVFQPPVVFFDPTMPGGNGDVSRIPDWERRLNIKMNPIGELSGGHSVLVFGEDGRIFGTLDGLLYLYGKSFEDALENTLLFGKRVPQRIGDLKDG